ncbi:MAG TPA: alpha-L-fucosidase, partial [Longimicrobiales bacterium]|nr:alpha-L-fucosidase [Longimicrobiales bacterium]
MEKTRFVHRNPRVQLAPLLALALVPFLAGTGSAQAPEDEFAGWEELAVEPPEWYRDAKFGIYFHWGVYSVPAHHSEWYSRNMYNTGTSVYRHHVATYGPIDEFGYKDFVPMFTGEHFDADEWVDLFVRAGARFTGPVAEHADGFSMWRSRVNSWNSFDRGPRIDVVGEMADAARRRGLRFLTTFHHQWHWGWYPTFRDPSEADAGDPAYAELYGPVVSEAAWRQRDDAERPDDAFNRRYTDKVLEVIDGYAPDMIYFDSRFSHIGIEYRREIVERFAESLRARGAEGEGIVFYKLEDLPEYVGVRTIEKARLNHISGRVWQAEEPITTFAWNYYEGMVLRPPESILHALIDVVSKNGVYLLNIGPRPDGVIPDDQAEILLAIGEWL